MKTKVERFRESREFIAAIKPHFWSGWTYSRVRFLTRSQAEAYASRWAWKLKHPKRYARMLRENPKEFFTGCN